MNILHIICSPRLDSYSRHLSNAVVDRLTAARPDARVTTRDLGRNPLAHIDDPFAESLSSPAALVAAMGTDIFDLSDELIVERHEANGKTHSWSFQPYWLRVIMADPPESDSPLLLKSHGRSLAVGSFLTATERLDLARALERALAAQRDTASV